MAWQFQDIKYGWKIGIAAILTGTTIFVADNIRYRIFQRDAIQVILGTDERCYATQTGTNADGSGIYAVAPLSIVRNWYSNDYVSTVTNGVTNWTAVLYTNVFTNVIGDRTDHAMMVSVDAKIKALCPLYVDTNSVYDGTTNIVMLTFTGLLTSLNLGDHTNFTSIPAIGTNVATFGPWAWRNYIVAWQERYKVLNALKVRLLGSYAGTSFPEVVRTATVKGQGYISGGGNCNMYYGYSYNLLGVADNSEYNIKIDNRAPGGSAGDDYITLGMSEGGTLPGNALEFKLDTSQSGTNLTTFSSELTLDADPVFVKIVNCFGYIDLLTVSHTTSKATVSVELDRTGGECAHVAFYGVINFPFLYCTNSW